MTRQNWDKVADAEFYAMDKDERAAWADLRTRLYRH